MCESKRIVPVCRDCGLWRKCVITRGFHDFFFFSSRRRHTRFDCDWSSDVCSSDLITIFGTSAKYLSALQKSGFVPAQAVDLTALRTVLSTGSPLLPEGFDYVYGDRKSVV